MNEFKLDNEPKINPGFQIPEDYFDDFSEKIMQQLPKNESKVIPLFQKRKKWIMAAAAVLLISFFIPMYNFSNDDYASIDEATLENYITYQSNINQYDLIGVLDSKDISDIQIENTFEDQAIEDVLTNTNLEEILAE
ncbi:MAG: hypothetical protein V4548_12850 [Bacteroidota bacterium]